MAKDKVLEELKKARQYNSKTYEEQLLNSYLKTYGVPLVEEEEKPTTTKNNKKK